MTDKLTKVAEYVPQSLGESPNKPNLTVLTSLIGEAMDAENVMFVGMPKEDAATLLDPPAPPETNEDDDEDDVMVPESMRVQEYQSLLAIAHKSISHVEQHAVSYQNLPLAEAANSAAYGCILAMRAVNTIAVTAALDEDLQ